METTKEMLEARVRETPLLDRLKGCRQRIGKMCSEGRPPRMCIPVQHDDDDFFISTTLADAQAAVEALQRERDEAIREHGKESGFWGRSCARLLDKRDELQATLDAEREKVKGLHEVTKVICTHCCEPMEIPSKAVLQTQLTQLQALVQAKEAAYEKILLSREQLEREVRGYPPVDNEGIPMVWQEPVGWVKRTNGGANAE